MRPATFGWTAGRIRAASSIVSIRRTMIRMQPLGAPNRAEAMRRNPRRAFCQPVSAMMPESLWSMCSRQRWTHKAKQRPDRCDRRTSSNRRSCCTRRRRRARNRKIRAEVRNAWTCLARRSRRSRTRIARAMSRPTKRSSIEETKRFDCTFRRSASVLRRISRHRHRST